jgi:hypothetical protein
MRGCVSRATSLQILKPTSDRWTRTSSAAHENHSSPPSYLSVVFSPAHSADILLSIDPGHGALNRVPYPDVAVHFGPIIRVSNRFLGRIHKESMRGSVGHSEVAPSTLCNITRWCSMANLSDAFVGLVNYKLPIDVTSKVYHALELLTPMRLYHPVRNVGSASSKESVKHVLEAAKRGEHIVTDDRRVDRISNNTALCLLRNPRPLRPSYNCPIGCPHYLQKTCPTVNCMYDGSGTYNHMAVRDCMSMCGKSCPFLTATAEAKRKRAPQDEWKLRLQRRAASGGALFSSNLGTLD